MYISARKVVLWFCCLGLFSFHVSAQTLPDGEGKDLVQKICTACHGLETALMDGHSEDAWKKLVNTMISRGAEGTDAEFALVIKYLAKNFPEKAASSGKSLGSKRRKVASVNSEILSGS